MRIFCVLHLFVFYAMKDWLTYFLTCLLTDRPTPVAANRYATSGARPGTRRTHHAGSVSGAGRTRTGYPRPSVDDQMLSGTSCFDDALYGLYGQRFYLFIYLIYDSTVTLNKD